MVTTTPLPFRLRAVLFDFDGTLTRPGALDFAALKREIGCPPDRFVLEWIEALPWRSRRAAALEALERFELAGAAGSQPNDGAEDLVLRLRAAGLKVGVLTRNGRAAVDLALARFTRLGPGMLDVIVTRDDEAAPKPAPDGVLRAAAVMGARPGETLLVGDYLLDMQAGRAAGAVTAFLTNGGAAHESAATGAWAVADRAPAGEEPGAGSSGEPATPDPSLCDFVVHGLEELDDVVRLGLPLPRGKLPDDLLAAHLAGSRTDDPSVLVPAGVGEDVAALDIAGHSVLVAHGDPITLTGGDVGRFAAMVNANDIATSGAEPRWLLATVLLPPETTPSQALTLLGDIAAAARDGGMSVVGGHTEITDAVSRPVVSMTALATVPRTSLRRKRDVRPGDHVVLTKAIAVEGTALLAAEAGERLRALGMSEAELDECRRLLPLVSVVPEARIAAGCAGVSAMHDVTEGGLATALRELCVAAGHGLAVRLDDVPVLPQTTRVCALLGADPLGLIASGSLLVCCRPEASAGLVDALGEAGIAAAVIAELGRPGGGLRALSGGRPVAWPHFAADEAARLLSGSGGGGG